jgi:F-type H+-transporting ATPase subunit b
MDATFWALIALLLFLYIVFRAKLPSAVTGMLDRRAERIRKDLDEARRLREEAQALLAEYESKRRDAGKEAEEIIRRARADAEAYAADTRQKLADMVERRTRMANDRIAQAEAQAIKDVRAAATDLAVAAAERIIAAEAKGEQAARLIEDSIAGLKKRLN